jgi:hypothetical protein
VEDNRYPVTARGNGWDDDDDWTGEPPEGRYDASRANPGFWAQARPPLSITAAGIGVALIVLILVWLL